MLHVPQQQVLQICRFLQIVVFCHSASICLMDFIRLSVRSLRKKNYPAWKFRMTNFLKGKGYWDYVDGDNEVAPETPERNATTEQKKALKDWQQGQSKVMYWLSMSITDSMMGYL